MELNTGHGRLLYIQNKTHNLNNWFDDLCKVDFYIEQGQRLSAAEDCCYLYFFSFDNSTDSYWCGRDVVGFESYLPEDLAFFDYYNGTVVEKELETPLLGLDELFTIVHKMKAEDSDLRNIAMTWRIKIAGIDHGRKVDQNSLIQMPKMTFQFFKSH